MIDKLDLRIPANRFFRPPVSELLRCQPSTSANAKVRPGMRYVSRADLRPLGIDAILHAYNKNGDGQSKLEILDIGKKGYSDIVALVESVTDGDLDALGIMRIDLTADVPGVAVAWFKDNARFKFKRMECEYGEIKYGVIGRGKVETITAGSRPNVYRIYDKVAESKMQFNRMLRHQNPDADALNFEREFGVKETDTLTRVERQCGGMRIPPEVATFGELHRAPEFNPFANVEILNSGHVVLPTPEEFTGLDYYTGIGMRAMLGRDGMQTFRKQLNRQTNGNAARTMQRYSRFLFDAGGHSISNADILEIYRESTIRQLSA